MNTAAAVKTAQERAKLISAVLALLGASKARFKAIKADFNGIWTEPAPANAPTE